MRHQTNQNGQFGFLPYSEDDLQWKKENRNLKIFIQNQQLQSNNSYQSSKRYFPLPKKNPKLFLMKSLDDLHVPKKQIKKKNLSPKNHQRQQTQPFFFEEKSVNEFNLNNFEENMPSSFLSRVQKCDFGMQTDQIDFSSLKKSYSEQNNCLKELIQLLQKEIIAFNKTITQNTDQINRLNSDLILLQQKLFEEKTKNSQIQQKLSKETELNQCMEYIIAELNEKVRQLMEKNDQLEDYIEEISYREEQKTMDIFLDSRQSLEMNSELNGKHQHFNEVLKKSESVCEQTASNILNDDMQNWSCSILQISSFNKTPNKVHEGQPLKENSAFQQNLPNKQPFIEQIMTKHQQQIIKLTEKIKYYEIQNQMLRRKKEISQKSNQQILQLRQKIQKLSEQNKIIKLIHNKSAKTGQSSNISERKITKKPKSQQKNQSSKSKKLTNQQSNKNPLQNKSSSNISVLKNEKMSDKSLKENQDSKQNQKISYVDKQKYSPKRKNPLQRKFVRKPAMSPRMSKLKSDQDSEVSLSLSPERA